MPLSRSAVRARHSCRAPLFSEQAQVALLERPRRYRGRALTSTRSRRDPGRPAAAGRFTMTAAASCSNRETATNPTTSATNVSHWADLSGCWQVAKCGGAACDFAKACCPPPPADEDSARTSTALYSSASWLQPAMAAVFIKTTNQLDLRGFASGRQWARRICCARRSWPPWG